MTTPAEVLTKLTPVVRAFLNEPRYAVVASIREDGLPHLTVVWYRLQHDTVLMNEGRKRTRSRHLRRDPRLAFCVEDGTRYVTLIGACELQSVDQERALDDIVSLAIRYLGEAHGGAMRTFFAQEQRETILLHIESVHTRGFDV